jgi:hypothetical protein
MRGHLRRAGRPCGTGGGCSYERTHRTHPGPASTYLPSVVFPYVRDRVAPGCAGTAAKSADSLTRLPIAWHLANTDVGQREAAGTCWPTPAKVIRSCPRLPMPTASPRASAADGGTGKSSGHGRAPAPDERDTWRARRAEGKEPLTVARQLPHRPTIERHGPLPTSGGIKDGPDDTARRQLGYPLLE